MKLIVINEFWTELDQINLPNIDSNEISYVYQEDSIDYSEELILDEYEQYWRLDNEYA